jgi:hydroxymethylbilane synthase
VAKEGNTELIKLLQTVEDTASRAQITAERSLVLKLEGGCRVPIGAVAQSEGNQLTLSGSVYSLEGRSKISAKATGTLAQAELLGAKVGEELIALGAQEFEREWREKYGAW